MVATRLVLVLALATLSAAAVPRPAPKDGKSWLDVKQWVEDRMQDIENFVADLWNSATAQVEQFVHDTGIDDAVNKALADIQKIVDDAAALSIYTLTLGQDVTACVAADKDQIISIGESVLIDAITCIGSNVDLLVQINNAKNLVERVLADDAACDGDLICRGEVWLGAESDLEDIIGPVVGDISGGIDPIVAEIVAAAVPCATTAAGNNLPAIEALVADVAKCAVA